MSVIRKLKSSYDMKYTHTFCGTSYALGWSDYHLLSTTSVIHHRPQNGKERSSDTQFLLPRAWLTLVGSLSASPYMHSPSPSPPCPPPAWVGCWQGDLQSLPESIALHTGMLTLCSSAFSTLGALPGDALAFEQNSMVKNHSFPEG